MQNDIEKFILDIEALSSQRKFRRKIVKAQTTINFNSNLPLHIFKINGFSENIYLGPTPIEFSIADGESWFVYAPAIAPGDFTQLVSELTTYMAPGLTLGKGSLGATELAQLGSIPSLSTLSLNDGWNDLSGIENVNQVKELVIASNMAITDSEIAKTAMMTGLEILNLTNSQNITNAAMPALAGSNSLKFLYLNRSKVDDTGIHDLLMGAPGLIGLHMERLNITDASITEILSRPQMESLDFDETNVSDAGIAQLVALTSLKHLDLKDTKGTPVSDNTLLGLSQHLTQLKVFLTTSPAITDGGMMNMGNLVELESLTMNCMLLGDLGITSIGALVKLEELFLDNTGIGELGLASLSPLTELRLLSLVNTGLTDAQLVYLEGFSKLKELDARHTNVTASGKANLESKVPGLTVFI